MFVGFVFILFFKRFYLFTFRERGREEEREGRKHQCVVASHVAPTGDLACIPGMCPDWESDWQPFGSQLALNPLSYTSQGKMFAVLIQQACVNSLHSLRELIHPVIPLDYICAMCEIC